MDPTKLERIAQHAATNPPIASKTTTSVDATRVHAPIEVVATEIVSAGDNNNLGKGVLEDTARLGTFTEAQIKELADNPDLSARQRMAAKWLLRAMSDQQTKQGSFIATAELQNLFDRFLGRPGMAIDISVEKKSVSIIAMTDEALKAIGELG